MHCMVSRVNKKPLYAGREFKYIHPWRINADHKEIVSHIFQSPHTGEEEWPLSSQAKEALEPDMRGDTGDSGESKAAGRHLGFGVCTWWKITMMKRKST